MKKMQNKVMVLVLVLAMAMAVGLTGCGVTINEIAIPAMVELVEGETTALEVTYTADNANVSDEALLEAADKLALEWTSSDETVATVDENGNVTAVNGGEATITVTDGNGLSATTKVSVRVPLKGFEAEASMNLYINGKVEDIVASKPLVVGPIPADADDYAPVYESEDESIATVDETGKVTAVSNGRTTVTVKSGDISTEVEVTVYTVPSYIEAEDTELYVGRSGELKVTVDAENVTYTNALSYTSSDEDVVKVNKDGVISGISEGEATITVSNGTGIVGTATVTVVPAPVATTTGNGNASGGSGSTGNNASGNSSGSTGSSGGSTGTSGGDDAVETAGPAPEPAPAPAPEPAPAPAPVPGNGKTCDVCGAAGHVGSECPNVTHYHGNGSDTGTCPGCGVMYSTWHQEVLINPETNPELYC